MEVLCYGVIPLRKIQSEWKIFLICHKNGGHWAFPKGHAEKGETPIQVAKRELFEETALSITTLLSDNMIEESYSFKEKETFIQKRVGYFIANVEGEPSLQKEELLDADWFSIQQAQQKLTYPESRRLLNSVLKKIENL